MAFAQFLAIVRGEVDECQGAAGRSDARRLGKYRAEIQRIV